MSPGVVLELVRAPAALTVVGDAVVGMRHLAPEQRAQRRRRLLPAASVALYSAGMALNDVADRRLDAVERPERPIPSGRIGVRAATLVAAALAAGGVVLAGIGGGRRSGAVAGCLVGAIAAYDLVAKQTSAGPFVMAACRGLDVMMGAAASPRAIPAAVVVAAHTLGVTVLSRGEVHGGTPGAARAAIAATGTAAIGAVAGNATAVASEARSDAPCDRAASSLAATLGGVAAYLAAALPGQLRAAHEPTAAVVRSATRASLTAVVPLQATLAARAGATGAAAALLGVAGVLGALTRRRTGGDVT
ncbi:SCO3242 family prenyltransferase [Agromyces mangrovi Wang et al. 2018]|uniref:SCO3242 family prenyltransferase n=1 Tax=Agromyces mangrovi TaxID=1858653 RepID=UPI002572B7D4|nr:UbiA family prenyltransferase [Agromyces mangrovi]BDZ65232.1 transferase [Agromyces mangrovi]